MIHAPQKSVRFSFVDASIGSLSATSPSDDAKGKEVEIRLRDDTLVPTSRFWDSLFRKYRIPKGIFRLFNENEVFRRIHERAGDSRVRFCIEQNEVGQNRLLGVSSPRDAVPQPNSIVEVIKRFDGANLAYSDGVFRSTHIPRADESNFLIGPDAFQRRFVLESPVDGHGSPRTCLALLREICTNGMVAECAAFRSEIRAGDDVAYAIQRALTTFDNAEGFDALKQRVDSAQNSWASLYEVQRCIRCVSELKSNTVTPMQAASSLRRLAGNPQELYGVANLDELPPKRQRLLPTKCKVYDVLNHLSELSSHHAATDTRTRIDRLVGSLVSDEYDLEGSANGKSDFADFTLN